MKVDYTLLHSEQPVSENVHDKLVKTDDVSLPEFVREVPAFKKSFSGDSTSITYNWKQNLGDFIKIKSIEYRNTEDLSYLYRINSRDGTDTIVVRHKSISYILRKTSRDVARALYVSCAKARSYLENIVGYAKTLFGHFYTISKLENSSWTFSSAAGNEMRTMNIDSLKEAEKARLVELIVENMVRLHSENFIIKEFSISNLTFVKDDVVFSDLRNLRLSRKFDALVEEFRKLLVYLFNSGIASYGDVYHAIAVYSNSLPGHCGEWYKCKKGSLPKDTESVVSLMETSVF